MTPTTRSLFPLFGLAFAALLSLAGCGGSTNVGPALPVAKAGADRTASVGEGVLFDGSASLHAVSWHWEFGDNTTSDEATVEHTYATAGTFQAVLTVRNSVGGSDRDTVEITVSDIHAAPTAAVVGPSKGRMGDALTFDGSTSSGASPIVSYAWTFGDGGTASGASATHFFAANGQYSVQLTVEDASGLSGSASLTVTIGDDVGNRPPVAVPGHDVTARVGETVVLDGTASYDLDSGDSITAYDWDFGDGSAHATTDQPSHAWATAGTFTLKLKVTDAHAASSEAAAKATILPPPDYNGRWTLVPDKASVTCGKTTITFPAGTLDFTHAGSSLSAQDPATAARKLTGTLTGFHFSTKGVFGSTGSCGSATSTETFAGDFKISNDKALAGSYAIYQAYSDMACNCTATFGVSGTRP
ncbi:MAG TPA: PKD domain-containing protein [Myxococcales bacterium]